MAERTEKFDEKIKTRLVAKDTDLEVMKEQPYWNRLSLNENDEEFMREYRHLIKLDDIPTNDKVTPEEQTPDSFDGFLKMELGMPRGTDGEIEHATDKRRAVDVSGQPIGIANSNPMLDTREYEIAIFRCR